MEKSELPQGEISGVVLLYSKPEPLNPELHGKLGVKALDAPYGFAAGAHLIPLTVTEFQPTAMFYPIIYVGDDYTPVAVMGLKEGENLFLRADVQIADIYVPAYVRRYPFVFANDQTSDRMILCIDRDAKMLDENGGEVSLFENGEPTEFTRNAMEFCREFEGERRRTEDFVKVLRDNDLFEIKNAVFTPRNPDGSTGEPQTLAEYYAVSEEKLAKLSKDKVAELFENGALQQIYAGMASLLNWERLIMRAMSQPAPAANLN